MKYLVLGAAGMQARATVHDLCHHSDATEIVCADLQPENLLKFSKFLDMGKIMLKKLEAGNKEALIQLMSENVDVVIDMLPIFTIPTVAEAAVEAGVPLVNTFYANALPKDIHEKALAKDIIILPESGLDPGIDLVLCGYGASKLDEVHEFHSYCGGFPDAAAANNPLKYKVTLTWKGMMLAQKRHSRIMKDGKEIDIPAEDQHAPEWLETMDFPGFGPLELIVNGDAVEFGRLLGISSTLRNASRRYIRWPGHAQLWHTLKQLNFLSEEPVAGLSSPITPLDFMTAHIGPQIQYKDDEKDLVLMRIVVGGVKDGQNVRITYDLLDYRDTETGLFAMNRTVGYTSSIVAQMIASQEIRGKGLLRPTNDIPHLPFIEQLRRRNITVKETVEALQEQR